MQTKLQNNNVPVRGRRTYWVLSLIAFAPLAIVAALVLMSDRNNAVSLPLLDAFKTISAITLSFLGGVRWD